MNDSWEKQVQSMGKKIYSQGFQDGFIEFIFKNIGTTNNYCVEFGFNSNKLKGGGGSNTCRLVLENGWKSILFDKDYENSKINLYKEYLTPDNLKDIFVKHNVPQECDYISIDVDSVDLWLLKSLLTNGYRPRLISVEYNSNFPIDVSATVVPGTKWEADTVYGASLLALNRVAEEFEYHLICVSKGLDLFFIRGDLISKNDMPSLLDFSEFTAVRTWNVNLPSDRIELFVKYPSMDSFSISDIERLKNFI